MRMRFINTGIWLCILLCLTTSLVGEVHRIQAWKSTSSLDREISAFPSDLLPTLPSPYLIREPEYTWGLSNTLHWANDSVLSEIKPLGVTLLFFEIQATYEGHELWGFVESSMDTATFRNLPEGIPIQYRLRYYARNTSGLYLLSYWSPPVTSIQDSHSPALNSWEIIGLQKTISGSWVVGKTILIHLTASDSNGGKIMEAVLREINPSNDNTFYYDFHHPAARVDTTFPYQIHAPQRTELELQIWVVDVSGRASSIESIRFFWWPENEQERKVVCFPNPFNPAAGQISTIKVDIPDLYEARIFDPFGNLIRVLHKQPENHFFEWNGKNDRGDMVSTGAYLFVLKENQRMYSKIVVQK